MNITECPQCGEELVSSGGTYTTLVGYSSPLGHNHDDNCRSRAYLCANGHVVRLSRRNRCDFPGCAWKGKADCFCHPHAKVDDWPEDIKRREAATVQP